MDMFLWGSSLTRTWVPKHKNYIKIMQK
ncbi:hypothetical protein [Plasmodium yoelii yoelii]|uniref:Uncharacterized protein n=1 Tax=Plasmodium yoelii yoelii TaxID=73239 RepID=Q7RBB1_PLAYO|nr:hypothetical protein [Plasmodium yoelii yoelii]